MSAGAVKICCTLGTNCKPPFAIARPRQIWSKDISAQVVRYIHFGWNLTNIKVPAASQPKFALRPNLRPQDLPHLQQAAKAGKELPCLNIMFLASQGRQRGFVNSLEVDRVA